MMYDRLHYDVADALWRYFHDTHPDPDSGVVYAHQMKVSIGTCIHDLDLIAKAGEIGDLVNRVQFLPL